MKRFFIITVLSCLLSTLGQAQYPVLFTSVSPGGAGCGVPINFNRNATIDITAVPAGTTVILDAPAAGIQAPAPAPVGTTISFDLSTIVGNTAVGTVLNFPVRVNGNITCSINVTNNVQAGGGGGSVGTSITYNSLDELVYSKYDFDIYFDRKKNLYIKDGVVHIFMDDEGRLIMTGTPTAVQENYTYQLHVFGPAASKISFSSKGDYKPEFLNIQVSSSGASQISSGGAPTQMHEFESNIFGPFTGSFTLKVLNNKNVIFNNSFSASKRYHLSIVTGLIGTSLSDPQNIQKALKPGSTTDYTLTADNPSWRGMISVMAVFYPTPRSFLFEPTTLKERLGIVVGTRIDKDAFQNLLGGLQFEFARGGSITAGAHFGQRSAVAGYPNFKFGTQTFPSGSDPIVIKEWNVGFFIGVNLDLKIVQYFITGGAQPK